MIRLLLALLFVSVVPEHIVDPSPAPPGCTEDALIAALNPTDPDVRREVQTLIGQRQLAVSLDREEVVYGLGQARFQINDDGGDGCVSPFAMSDVEWMADDDVAFDLDAAREAVLGDHLPGAMAATGLTESQIREIANGEGDGGATPDQAMRLLEYGQGVAISPLSDDPDQSGVYFHIFAPSLIPAMGGGVSGPERLNNKSGIITRHDGVGGWKANSGANLLVYMPGTHAGDIRAGATYRATAYSMSPEDVGPEPPGPETGNVLYTQWEGALSRFMCYGESRQRFEGEQTGLWGRLEGTVTIDAVSTDEVSGSFELSGEGDLETTTYSVVPSGDRDCPSRDDAVQDTRSIPISTSGSFVAPNVSQPAVFMVAGIGRAVPVGR